MNHVYFMCETNSVTCIYKLGTKLVMISHLRCLFFFFFFRLGHSIVDYWFFPQWEMTGVLSQISKNFTVATLTLIPLGGGLSPPPVVFFCRASRPIGISRSNFMTFFSQVSRIFWYIIHTLVGHVELILEVDNCSTVTKKLQFLYRFLCNSIYPMPCKTPDLL